jgi:hypothetical protein
MHASALASSRLIRPEKMRAKARSTRQTVPSQAPAPSEHSNYVWSLENFEVVHDIRAAKELRKIARVCKTFAHHARFDEDNNIPALAPGGITLLTLLLSEDSSDDDD